MRRSSFLVSSGGMGGGCLSAPPFEGVPFPGVPLASPPLNTTLSFEADFSGEAFFSDAGAVADRPGASEGGAPAADVPSGPAAADDASWALSELVPLPLTPFSRGVAGVPPVPLRSAGAPALTGVEAPAAPAASGLGLGARFFTGGKSALARASDAARHFFWRSAARVHASSAVEPSAMTFSGDSGDRCIDTVYRGASSTAMMRLTNTAPVSLSGHVAR
mmetsp:Transcript_18627/g.56241  ORF Transcript_18627/g.56241 Transcript_18627/m.56241 type:complete len:219 (+) Transcript_18627:4627-5283(+)